jgi:hypothetical protein
MNDIPEPRINPPELNTAERPDLPRCAYCCEPPDEAHPELIEWEGKMYCKPHWIDLVADYVQESAVEIAKEWGLTVQTFTQEDFDA